jgi:glycosyltransferase involved in cell wall biosynthesis
MIRDIDILGAGNLIPLKQYDVFISIIAEVKKTIPGIIAKICGKGPEENSLRSLIAKEGLQDNIILVGERPHTEVLQLMQRSRLFLHCASYEGFGSVCIEALYAGASVVSFNEPMKKKIRHWHIAKTKEDMLKKILELLQDPNPENDIVCPYQMQDSVIKIMQLFGH